MYQQRNLFGGAITAKLPNQCIDVSNLRQVPDNQEVFLYHDSAISIILEVLERVEADDNLKAAKFHFDSLKDDNAAQLATIDTIEDTTIGGNGGGDDTPSPVILSGRQTVPKSNRQLPDNIKVFMALYRVESKQSKRVDLVLTMNIPIVASEGDSVGEEGIPAAKSDFDTVLTSLRIVDYGLFA